jgi:hypothetical protein
MVFRIKKPNQKIRKKIKNSGLLLVTIHKVTKAESFRGVLSGSMIVIRRWWWLMEWQRPERIGLGEEGR